VGEEYTWTQRLEEKSFAPAVDWTPLVQSVVRHYTDWATQALFIIIEVLLPNNPGALTVHLVPIYL
jgi:hypothetical protein